MTHPLAGRKQSAEHIAKRVAAVRASGAYSRLAVENVARNKARTGFKHSDETKSAASARMKGKRYSLGTVRSIEFRQNLSRYWTGNPSHNFRVDGEGASRHAERSEAMSRLEYRVWRETIFKRDNYTCVFCGQHGGSLQADHILPWSTHPDKRYDPNNGRTLCKPCHLQTSTWGGRFFRCKS